MTSRLRYSIICFVACGFCRRKNSRCGSIAQLGEHLPYKQGVTGSSPIRVAIFGSVAQLVEQRTENPRVTGSIPVGATISAGLAHLVERHLAKVEVASSSLVTRSRKAVLHLQGGFCRIS